MKNYGDNIEFSNYYPIYREIGIEQLVMFFFPKFHEHCHILENITRHCSQCRTHTGVKEYQYIATKQTPE